MFSFQGASLNSFFQETQWNLSYSLPHFCFRFLWSFSQSLVLEVVGQNGLEPSTSRLSVVCSSQLSYWPVSLHFFWWRVPGSNRWPPACKAGALPAELTPHIHGIHFFQFLLYPLNWITLLFELFHTLVLTYRTLQVKSSLNLKSP